MTSEVVSIPKLDFSRLESETGAVLYGPRETTGLQEGSAKASEVVSVPKLDFSPLESETGAVLYGPRETTELQEGSAMASEVVSIPKFDFSRLESKTGADWDALQGQVMHALESYGCFEVEYDKVTPEFRDELFGRYWPELFALPLETKLLNKSDNFSDGYIGQIPGWTFESLGIREDVENFTRTLWPQGNPNFSNMVSTYFGHLKDLEQNISRMIFLGLGIGSYYNAYIESTRYENHVLEYGIPLDNESGNGLGEHFDSNLVTILCRNGVGGLEMQTKEGEWFMVAPSQNSFIVIIGEGIQDWTNGRLQAPLHRVRANNSEKRYTIVFGSKLKDGYIIQAPKELIDEEHPLLVRVK